jgi:hypothetical protein
MIIPNKHSGYQAGIRVYPMGGGGGGPSQPGMGDSQVGNTGGTTGVGTGIFIPPPPQPQTMTAQIYNQNLQSGMTDEQMRTMRTGPGKDAPFLYNSTSPNQWNEAVTQAGMQSPTGRPLAGSAQFYQPVYQSQYQNYNMGNPMGVSQYGQQPSFGPGFSGGFGGGFSGGFGGGGFSGGFMPQMQQPTMFGGQMQGGGYGQFGMNNPFSPFSNSFLNMDPNLNRGTVADKANMYRNAIQSGFGDQQIRGQAEGLFGQQTPQAWGYLQGSAMGMTPGLQQQSEQDKIGFYQGARNQGFNDQTIRNAANQMIGNQSQSDWSYLQNKSGYGGGFGGYGNQFMPQMQNPYSYQPTQTPTPYQPPMARTSSGPSQAIVGRSSQMRGTPNVMRRAEGGITSLMDEV